MKLKYLAAFLMLLAAGCNPPASDGTSGGDSDANGTAAATQTIDPETETQLASTTVKFDVTGMR
ncbi:MAG: hypothetical protein R3C28_12760 [Pirellulaceae bacterium]